MPDEIPPLPDPVALDTQKPVDVAASDVVDTGLDNTRVPSVPNEPPEKEKRTRRRKKRGRGRAATRRAETTHPAETTHRDDPAPPVASATKEDSIESLVTEDFISDTFVMLFSVIAVFAGAHWELTAKESKVSAKAIYQWAAKHLPTLTKSKSMGWILGILAAFILLPRIVKTVTLARKKKQNVDSQHRPDGNGQELRNRTAA